MNPYAAQLGDRDPLQVMASTSAQLSAAAQRLGAGGAMEKPWAPGKWSPREILAHLADCEIVFAYRLRQALAQDHHQIQPFDQDRWAGRYAAVAAAEALAVFRAVRAWNLELVATLAPADFSKLVTHPERGQLSFRELLETIAGHDLNHLAQLAQAK